MRRYYFPDDDDSPQSLARAIWIDKHELQRMEYAVGNAIAKLFKR
ncbi:hypothetical protein [Vibrio metschnikovii]